MTDTPQEHRRAQFAAEQWRRELPQMDTRAMQLVGQLGTVAQLMARDWLNPLFAEHGLQPGEFDVLATLRRSGAPHALTPTALYEAAMLSSGGMTNRIDRLEAAGLIERQKHPSDRRGVLVALTPRGLALIERLVLLHVDNERAMLASLGEDEQRQLDQLLAKLLQGMAQAKKG
ncbi:MarR family winged helix-turn-helix transcriptional regulator [Janthinobacterium sp. 1_2014MBL_MicDiv]|uniref:MarR family winged helix-turn-helix transcriptional regulator n=1 Tax=Janthinobacterium sp. 1_2014MBL_MicDiv TaxID=1644131 RepID=UPI0008F54460|nr:MarR family transcriptional regulator [Janthinobacterium sp. 1_2014MBL_MicDiv]APA71067.1 MarR family transcriptional regulator [Janthinobacterium sp. 1_2014MBL_MicDiv]